MDQVEFTDTGSLRRDSAFMLQLRFRKVSNSLSGWLMKTWFRRWPTMSELEMLDQSYFNIEEGIQRLREIGVLDWTCQIGRVHV